MAIDLVYGLVFFVPPVLGSILVALGIKSKVDGDNITNYGIIIGIGAAIILGWLGVMIAMSLPDSQQQELMQ